MAGTDLRRRPELFIGPALAVWLLVNCLPIAFGRPFIWGVFETAVFRGNAGNAFPITYACAIGLFLLPLVTYRSLSWPRRLLVAVAVPFAFTHLYEVPYDFLGYLEWPNDYGWAVWPITLLLNASWLSLGLSTAPYWRYDRKVGILLAAFLALFALWWIAYWPFIPSLAPPLNPEGSGYIVSKVVLALLVGSLVWNGRPGASLPLPGAGEAITPAPDGRLGMMGADSDRPGTS